ncbi:MAG: FAD:protein FMN transferase [Gammaproteobacteria bacterium]|nr:FAD:protein FMN transferase [Gammaproteobacteria bacterium]
MRLPELLTALLSAGIVASIVSGCQPSTADTKISGRTMGTGWVVRAAGCDLPDCAATLNALISQRLDELTRIFSHYEPESEVSAFNRHSGVEWFAVSAELASVAELSAQISQLSDGAFDITVAPAVDEWGFGPDANVTAAPVSAPTDAAVEAARRTTDYRKLHVRMSPPGLRKDDPKLRIDLSAIAKGYAVDQLAYLLEQEGIRNYLVEIGGEVRVAGNRPDGQRWRIGIEPPNADYPLIDYVIEPRDQAVASSGDYRNYYVMNDTRISHTINPVTATPVSNGLAAVSVIAPAAAQADALATALMVLGPDAGMELAEREGLAALLTERTATGLRVRQSTKFADYLVSYEPD